MPDKKIRTNKDFNTFGGNFVLSFFWGVLCSESLLSQFNTKNAEPVASCLSVTLEGGAKPFISSPGIKSWSQKVKFKWLLLFSGPKHLKFIELGTKIRYNTPSTISLGTPKRPFSVN